MVRRNQVKFTQEHCIKNREGKIYLDTFPNTYGATAVAPYAVRARSQASSAATPVTWDEVEGGANPRDWIIKHILNR